MGRTRRGSGRSDYRRKRPSSVPSGNRWVAGGQFARIGGAERSRFTTTLPAETLEQLDALALAHGLQRNEVITLALAVLSHPTAALPDARSRFGALADAWQGFTAGVQLPVTPPPAPGAQHPGSEPPPAGAG